MTDNFVGVLGNKTVGAEYLTDLPPGTHIPMSGIKEVKSSIIDDYIKGLFASMETSGDISGDYLRLEKATLRDLKQRKLVSNEITMDKIKKYPQIYDQVAQAYLNDLMTTFKIPTVEDAALWSYRPGWYQKYKGDINAIPDTAKGSFGKTGKEVMQLRSDLLQKHIKGKTNAK